MHNRDKHSDIDKYTYSCVVIEKSTHGKEGKLPMFEIVGYLNHKVHSEGCYEDIGFLIPNYYKNSII